MKQDEFYNDQYTTNNIIGRPLGYYRQTSMGPLIIPIIFIIFWIATAVGMGVMAFINFGPVGFVPVLMGCFGLALLVVLIKKLIEGKKTANKRVCAVSYDEYNRVFHFYNTNEMVINTVYVKDITYVRAEHPYIQNGRYTSVTEVLLVGLNADQRYSEQCVRGVEFADNIAYQMQTILDSEKNN